MDFDRVIFIRDWKDRRVVYTNKIIAFAKANTEKMMDVIPLHEIISVQDCDGVSTADAENDAGRIFLEIDINVIYRVVSVLTFSYLLKLQILTGP
jgi:hypothetical protein